jgi:hypothetical protein
VEGRPRIGELWVPTAALVEEGLEGDARILRSEARHRFKAKNGIRVFSGPDRLKEWMAAEKLDFDDHKHLITDAGQLVPGWAKDKDGVEFFVHSPFAERTDSGEVIDRNDCSLVMQAWFHIEAREVRLMLSSDTTHELWDAIIRVTRFHKNDDRLGWDIFKLPHHCSYLSLSAEKQTRECRAVLASPLFVQLVGTPANALLHKYRQGAVMGGCVRVESLLIEVTLAPILLRGVASSILSCGARFL